MKKDGIALAQGDTVFLEYTSAQPEIRGFQAAFVFGLPWKVRSAISGTPFAP